MKKPWKTLYEMKQTILVWSDQNIWDHLWRWSTLTGPVILVIQTEMSLFIRQKLIVVPSTAHLYCASLLAHIQYSKCVVAWTGTVELEYTLPLGMWNFRNFKLDYFWNGNCPEFLLVSLSDMLVKHLSPYQRYIVRPVIQNWEILQGTPVWINSLSSQSLQQADQKSKWWIGTNLWRTFVGRDWIWSR